MEQLLHDTAGMGALLWLAGHLAFYGRALLPAQLCLLGQGGPPLLHPVRSMDHVEVLHGPRPVLPVLRRRRVIWSIVKFLPDYPFIVLSVRCVPVLHSGCVSRDVPDSGHNRHVQVPAEACGNIRLSGEWYRNRGFYAVYQDRDFSEERSRMRPKVSRPIHL